MHNTPHTNGHPRGLYLPDGSVHRFAHGGSVKGLAEHIATRNRSPDFTALGMYLPNPDPILRKLGKAERVYAELRSDAHVGGAIRRRKAAVKAMEWRIVPSPTGQAAQPGAAVTGEASPAATALAQQALAALDVYHLIDEALDAPLFGWVPLEVIWARAPQARNALLPSAVLAKPHAWFHFDAEGSLRFRSRHSPMLGEELQPRKFLVPRQGASYANPYGFADLSMVFWPTTFKRGGLKFWVTFAEKFGTPWIVGKQPRSAGQAESDALLDQLESMVQDAVAVVPDDSSVDITQAGGKSDAAGAYKELLMFCRSEVSIALLGQNQSTESNSNRASATAGLEVEQTLRDGDARLVEQAVNQLLRWLTDLNESEDAPAPRFELFEQAEVSEVQAKRDEALSRAGLVFTPSYWMRAYGLEATDIAGALAPSPSPSPSPAASAAPSADAAPSDPQAAHDASALPGGGPSTFAEPVQPAPARDAIDALVDAELDQWQAVMEPLVSPVQAAIDEALAAGETAQQLIDRLPALLAQLSPLLLADHLTRLAVAARLGGLAGVPTDNTDAAAPPVAATATASAAPAPAPGSTA